jgi:hypothetical protein
MKLQFDPNQPYQLDAVAAVTDLFDGQPQGAPDSCSGYLCCFFCLPRALNQRKPLLFQRLESTEMVPERRPPRGPTGPQPVRGGPGGGARAQSGH